MKIKKHNVSNPNVNRDIGDFIKKTILQYFRGSMSVDEFIDKCDHLSMQFNSLQIRQLVKIQREKYSNILKVRGQECYINCQSPTPHNETPENGETQNVVYRKRKYKHKRRQETLEERHKRNGDKNVEFGYSSTGVPLPTTDQMKSHKKRKPFVRFIQVPMGGKSNRY